MKGNYFQSYKYFHRVKQDIRKIFDFHENVKSSVETYGNNLFQNDTESLKLCVHVRRGDLIKHNLLETRADFLIPAMDTVKNFISNRTQQKISLIFLTTDWKFVNSLNFSKSGFHKIYYPNLESRSSDMYFGIRHCNSILLSASGSTFGFWIAYLMPEESLVFYNGQIEDARGQRKYSKDLVDYDGYPKNWNILEFNKNKNVVEIDNRWYFEKFGLGHISNKNAVYL